jgi:hypothetical protein
VTRPDPFNDRLTSAALRRKWLNKFLNISEKYDRIVKLILLQGAEDARNRLIDLEFQKTFSAGVRAAQIRLAMNEIRIIHAQIFGDMIPIIKDGHKDAASIASEGLSEIDREYLEQVFRTKRNTQDWIDSQKRSAQLGVAHAISRVTKSEKPLSARVYRSRSLANQWVQRVVTSAILRGDSAKDIAKSVSGHINPATPGGTAYAALRLGRTELSNAFHATAITQAEDRPWIDSMEWNLSSTHVLQNCQCELLRQVRFFPIGKVPEKPHPHCRCFVTPVLEPFDTFLMKYKAGYYQDLTNEVA